MLYRLTALLLPLLITMPTQADDAARETGWIAELRTDCKASLKEMGYSNSRSRNICDCYTEKLGDKLDEDQEGGERETVSNEASPPLELDIHGMMMSCM